MKKIFILVLFVCNLFMSNHLFASAYIDSIIMVPANPSINDSITFQVYNEFGWAGCSVISRIIDIGNPTISVTATYCLGNYQGPCNSIDEYTFPPQSSGSYVFQYISYFSIAPSVCDSFVPIPDKKNLIFNVDSPSGNHTGKPYNDLFNVSIDNNNLSTVIIANFTQPLNLKIYNLQGKELYETTLNRKESYVETNFPDGLYLFCVSSQNQKQSKKVVISNKP